MPQKHRSFPHATVQIKTIPERYLGGGGKAKYFVTKRNGVYSQEFAKISAVVYRRVKDNRTRENIMAFCHNHFADKQELPSFAVLEKKFPILSTK